MPKYKAGDHIKILGACVPELLGKTVKVAKIYSDYYFIDLLDGNPVWKTWKIRIADNNTELDVVRTILYG